MSKRSGGIPGVSKGFDSVGAAPSERHIVVNVNENVDVNDNRLFEHSHSRHTVWLEDGISSILRRNTSRRGQKTQVVNDALRQYFRDKGWE